MGKTIIHVGLHKTATTFLQEKVWSNLKSYTCLTRPYTQHNYAFNQLQYADDSLYKKKAVENEISTIGESNILLSDESFSGKPIFFSYINRTLIAKRLQEIFPKAEIILFIRDQKDIIKSHYSSYVKMPYGTKRIENFFYKPDCDYSYEQYIKSVNPGIEKTLYYDTNDFYIHLDCFKYSYIIDLYSQLFDKCHVFIYEDFKKDNRSTLMRLQEILGENIYIESTKPVNKSLSKFNLEQRRLSNKFTYTLENKYIKKISRLITNVIPIINIQNLDFCISNMVKDYYSKDNKLLKDKLTDVDWSAHPNKYISCE